MTSGQFQSILISSITIDRENRQRRELTGIEELADSISRLGLIHPIVVDRELKLWAGERRLTAVRSLGWTHIPAQYTDEIDPKVLHQIELEENIKRVDITWQDECRAIQEYHNLRSESEPTWTAAQTAEALGVSPMKISERLDVAKALENPRVAEAPKFSVARGIVQRDNSRRASSAVASLKESVGAPEPESPILTADFHEWVPTYDGEPFNLIHCDFPYGIDMQDSGQAGNAAHGDYDDGEEVYWRLLRSFAHNLDRFMAPSAHLMFWFSMKFYTPTLEYFRRETDIIINPTPLVWTKSDNVGILADPSRGPRNILEFCLLGSRGDRKVVQAVSNGIAAPTVRDKHMSEKPEAVLRHYFRMLCDDTTSLLDPTCGSGSAIRAAKASGAARVLGLERNPEFAQRAREAL